MTETFKIDENLYTLHGKIKNVHLASKDTGGIHLYLTRTPFYYENKEEASISVHLTKDEALMLAKEILYRVANSIMNKTNLMINLINRW